MKDPVKYLGWGNFRTALHNNPIASEKIVSWYRSGDGNGAGQHQIWGDLIDLSSYLVLIGIIMMVRDIEHSLGRYTLRNFTIGVIMNGIMGCIGRT